MGSAEIIGIIIAIGVVLTNVFQNTKARTVQKLENELLIKDLKDASKKNMDHINEHHRKFSENVSVIVSELRTETRKAISNLTTEFSDLKNFLKEELKEHRVELGKAKKLLTIIEDIENDYHNLTCNVTDPGLRQCVRDGMNNTIMFVDSVLKIGLDKITIETIQDMLDVKVERGREKVKRHNKEIAKNWKVVHEQHAKRYAEDLAEIFDPKTIKYNNKLGIFINATKMFVQRALVGIMVAWEMDDKK